MTPIREHVPYFTMDTEDMPSKAPGMNPNRMPINILYSRKVSRGKCHNTQFSRMRNILEVFERNLPVTATTPDCEEILDGNYKPENNTDSKELFKKKKKLHVQCFQQNPPE